MKQTWLIEIGAERTLLSPRHVDLIVDRARAWHKTPQQAFDRIVNSGLRSLMRVVRSENPDSARGEK